MEKKLTCLRSKSMTSRLYSTVQYTLLFLPATSLSLSRSLEGSFELTRHPSRAFNLPRALLRELQRIKETNRDAVLSAGVPGHRQEQTKTLIVRLLTHAKSCSVNWVAREPPNPLLYPPP